MTLDIAARMQMYGGQFAQTLADAWICADESNRDKLEQAFGDLFARYDVND